MSILTKDFRKGLSLSKIPETKCNTIVIVFALSLLLTTITNSTALADDNVRTGSAFLSVSIMESFDDSDNDAIINNGVFMVVSKLPLTPVSSASTAKTQNRKIVIVTAYSSTPDQTDSTPFITANGTRVHDGIVAANFLPFGTKVKFPEVYGDKIFTVQDRMAKKNSHKIDIWMPSRQLALNFGVKRLAYEIVQ